MKARLDIAPIAWCNDDLPEISGDISLEGCLSEAREAGFTGMETGRRAAVLRVMANAGYTVEDRP